MRDVRLRVRLSEEVERVTLEPQGCEIPFQAAEGAVEVQVDEFTCHQMVVLHYGR